MSHYTAACFQFSVSKKKTKVIEVLKCFKRGNKKIKLPKHDFFRHEYWDSIFSMGIGYSTIVIKDNGDSIFFHLQGEIPFEPEIIEDFVSWVAPYAQGHGAGCFIGWSIYESATNPTIHYGDL